MFELLAKVQHAERIYQTECGQMPSPEYLAKEIGISVEKVKLVKSVRPAVNYLATVPCFKSSVVFFVSHVNCCSQTVHSLALGLYVGMHGAGLEASQGTGNAGVGYGRGGRRFGWRPAGG